MYIGILLSTLILLFLAYRIYGRWLEKSCRVHASNTTPAHTQKDGVDYVPTPPAILFGHHFSSIAGAGPIVGPILAAHYFGWGVSWLWILIGAIFIGGVHDFGSTLLSLRHKGLSIAETTRKYVGKEVGLLFTLFVIIALIYVIIVFLDLTAITFSQTPAVATASGWYILCALAMGLILLKKWMRFATASFLFIPLAFLGLLIGYYFPSTLTDKNTWIVIILLYCFVAAVLPVHILLQPRDFLSASFLYVIVIAGTIGLFLTNPSLQEQEFFTGWYNPEIGYLFPLLFITVACGACSGFHSIVASGTTSKQIACETDTLKVSYGSMLLEAFLATLAIGTFIVLLPEQKEGATPVSMFASGLGTFLSHLGLPYNVGREFSLLAVSTFLLTTLDTCTRLTRFLLEEIVQIRNQWTRFGGTALVLILPGSLAFVTINGDPIWKAIWPLFGATNQLMAALALCTVVVYLRVHKMNYRFALVPALLMTLMPLWALGDIIYRQGPLSLLGIIAIAMIAIGSYVSWQSLLVALHSKNALPHPAGNS